MLGSPLKPKLRAECRTIPLPLIELKGAKCEPRIYVTESDALRFAALITRSALPLTQVVRRCRNMPPR